MEHWAKRVLSAILLILITLPAFLTWQGKPVVAQTQTRKTKIVVAYTEYEWWLLNWADNKILCKIPTDHEGLPTPQEVSQTCGSDIQIMWQTTPPCLIKDGGDTTSCEGVYLHLIGSQPKTRDVIIDLPPSSVTLNLDGCIPTPIDHRCIQMPSLVLKGEEPLPNEHITAIHGIFDGNPFTCDTPVCEIPLHTTPIEGVSLEFYADSSYGDSSEHFTAQVRVVDTGISNAPGESGWFVDVISTQWQGDPLSTCGQIWQVFPPLGGPPQWLSSPDSSELLASDGPYYYLAGRMISGGLVDASECTTGGLLSNGYADICGLEKARPQVDEWQNQFDKRIVEVSKNTGVPAQLMKNLFAEESQFWPGIFRVPYEFGLGQITDQGADSVLLWNQSFYQQFCPLVLAKDTCDRGYLHLTAREQATVRGALALQAKSDCKDCDTGIDLSNTNFSISLFANTLVANCSQVNQSIYTATKQSAGSVSTFEDLWRFTVANYHAGPGCVSYAIHQAWQNTGKLTWDDVSTHFTEPCNGTVPYVNQIAQNNLPVAATQVSPTGSITPTLQATLTAQPTPTLQATPTTLPTSTAQATQTPQVTPTSSITPTVTATPTSSATPTPTAQSTSSILANPTASTTPTLQATPTATMPPTLTPTSTAQNTPTSTPQATQTSQPAPLSGLTSTPPAKPTARPTSTIQADFSKGG